MKRKPCPNCGRSGKKLWTVHNCSSYLPEIMVECPTCHWCGKGMPFKWMAELMWNRLARKVKKHGL